MKTKFRYAKLLLTITVAALFSQSALSAPAANGAAAAKKGVAARANPPLPASPSPASRLKSPKNSIQGVPALPNAPGGQQLSLPTLPSAAAEAPPAARPSGEVEIRGQVRNINMMLILKNKRDGISGMGLRTDYKKEIRKTNF